MTSEQKKAIDACKDQAAQEKGFDSYSHFEQARRGKTFYHSDRTEIEYRATQLYGEQCHNDALIRISKLLEPHLPCAGCDVGDFYCPLPCGEALIAKITGKGK